MIRQSPWKVIKSYDKQLGRFQLKQDEIQLPNTEKIEFSYIRFHDGVCILTLTEDNQIIALSQYRHTVREWEWEFPSGMIDEGELPLATAKRELLEETGYKADNWVDLGFFYPSAGSTSEKIYLFAAIDAFQAAEQSLEESEEIKAKLLALEELESLIAKGVRHGDGLASLFRYKCRQK